jgi:hypothetical protein
MADEKIKVKDVVYEEPPVQTWGRQRYADVDETIEREEMQRWFGMNLGRGVGSKEINALRAKFYGAKNQEENGFGIRTRSITRDGDVWLYVYKYPTDA